MAQHSVIEIKKPRAFTKDQLARFLALVREMMEIPMGSDCESLDGRMSVAVLRAGDGMTVKYSMGTRYCCTCTQGESDSGDCGGCMKSNRQWGAVRQSAAYRGEVRNFKLSAKRSGPRRKKTRAVK